MAYTESDLTAIRRAIARGERSVQFADRTTTYRSMEELLQAEQRIAAALNSADTTRRSKQSLAYPDKGL